MIRGARVMDSKKVSSLWALKPKGLSPWSERRKLIVLAAGGFIAWGVIAGVAYLLTRLVA